MSAHVLLEVRFLLATHDCSNLWASFVDSTYMCIEIFCSGLGAAVFPVSNQCSKDSFSFCNVSNSDFGFS